MMSHMHIEKPVLTLNTLREEALTSQNALIIYWLKQVNIVGE